MIRSFSSNGLILTVEYYSGLKNLDNNFLYLYDGYQKLSITTKFTLSIDQDADINDIRNVLQLNLSNTKIKTSFNIYNDNNYVVGSKSYANELFKYLNYSQALSDEEVYALSSTLTSSIAMNIDETGGFWRGNSYSTEIVISGLVGLSSLSSGLVKSCVVNEFPYFDEKTGKVENIQCKSVYGPDNEEYEEANKFIKNIQIGNIPNLIESENGEDHLLSIYCAVRKSNSDDYGTWVKCLTSSVNAINIGQKTNEGQYLPVVISIPDYITGLEAGDQVQMAVFKHTVNEINLNKPDWTSGDFTYVTLESIEPPIINNIEDGARFPDVIHKGNDNEIASVSPMITATAMQIAFYDSITLQFTDDGGQTWYDFAMSRIMLEGPTYKYETDENGNIVLDSSGQPIYVLDENGNRIIDTDENGNLLEGTYGYVYTTNREYKTIGNYTLQARIVIDTGDIVTAEPISFEIYENIIPVPVIQYYTDSDDTRIVLEGDSLHSNVPVYVTYEEIEGYFISLYSLNSDGSTWTYIGEDYRFADKGTYTIKAELITLNGETSNTIAKFTISNDLPAIIEVEGVSDYDLAESYSIKVKRDSTSTYKITYTNKTTGVTTEPTLITETDSNGITWYTFNITVVGIYDLNIIATHKDSLLTRTKSITDFELAVGITSEKPILFNPDRAPVHSTIMSLVPANIKNNLYYWLNTKSGNGTRFLSPLLLTENTKVYSKEVYGSSNNEEESTFSGIVEYLPELPIVNGVYDGETTFSSKVITFTNNASKPTQAEYIILLDGKQLNNPFEGEYTIETEGYHYILILGWDKVRPVDFCYDEIEFLIKSETNDTLREPGIVIGTENSNGEVEFTVNFSALHPDVTHSITITYNDGTKESYTYPYNQGIVALKVTKNCVITATSVFGSGDKYSKSSSAMVNCIFDTKPDIRDLHVFGINEMVIETVSFGEYRMNIGPCAWINFPHGTNMDYDVYINGMPYINYSDYEDETDETYGKDAHFAPIIENETEELRKYSLEVIAKNRFEPNKTSYYYNEFIIDSLGHPYPSLENIYPNIMNRLALPQEIREKHEENISEVDVLLNNRVIEITSYVIPKDDEYFLTITYTYYDGTKRTSCFQFSINSNVIDNLKPLRLIIKAKDFQDIPNYSTYLEKGYESVAHDGELIIDRQTGHLYFANNNEINEIELVPITKDMELMVNEIESSLLLADKSLNKLHYYHDLAQEMMEYYIGDLSEFLSKIAKCRETLDITTYELDLLNVEIQELQDDITNFKDKSINDTDYTSKEITDNVNSLQKDMTSLMTKFLDLTSNKIPSLFARGAVVKEDSYTLQTEIRKKVSNSDYNTWYNNEINKFNRFKEEVQSFYGVS